VIRCSDAPDQTTEPVTMYDKSLNFASTPIPGLQVWDLPVHGDHRGWFKENWQRQKMVTAGLPDFQPVQNNVSFNDEVGTTRGIHAEPWDKWVSVVTGRVFAAWVDLREGPTFGHVFSTEIDPSVAVFVPHGVANSYQTLEPNTTYSYLVNDHWSPDAAYTFLNLADESVAIDWPIPLSQALISEKDAQHPRLDEVTPIRPRRILVIGANGQVGRALRGALAGRDEVDYVGRDEFDLSSDDLPSSRNWRAYDVVINAAAFTAVDRAETPEARPSAWTINASAVARLAQVARTNNLTLVHISSDYVFDGTKSSPYVEDDSFSPMSAYGASKAAGDLVAATAPRHYIVRTSWVIGNGGNFVRTMADLAARGVDPRVVDDQFGRLTFTSDLARGILHLIDSRAQYGTYNLTGSGEARSWAQIAKDVFALTGHDPERVSGVSTDEYYSRVEVPVARRPRNSVLDLSKIEATGFSPSDMSESLRHHLGS